MYQDTPEKLILRDRLALDRTGLANERTLLAYLRTALMALISAVTLIKLFPDSTVMQLTGLALLPTGLLIMVIGAWRFIGMRRRIAASTGD